MKTFEIRVEIQESGKCILKINNDFSSKSTIENFDNLSKLFQETQKEIEEAIAGHLKYKKAFQNE